MIKMFVKYTTSTNAYISSTNIQFEQILYLQFFTWNIKHKSIKSPILFKSFNFDISFFKNSGTVIVVVVVGFHYFFLRKLKKRQAKYFKKQQR